jgi:hypothetical protein
MKMVKMLNVDSGKREWFLAVGTGYVQGEDVAAKGRILLFEVRLRELLSPPLLLLLFRTL